MKHCDTERRRNDGNLIFSFLRAQWLKMRLTQSPEFSLFRCSIHARTYATFYHVRCSVDLGTRIKGGSFGYISSIYFIDNFFNEKIYSRHHHECISSERNALVFH